MPRAERPIDAAETELGSFAADLRRLREKAGKPAYRELASRAHYSAATLADAASGRKLPTLAVTLAYVSACGGDTEEWEKRWRLIASPPDATDDAPYVGLTAFQPQDADRFFGRENLTRKLEGLVAAKPFVGVVGPSGSGKSSLLRAGLVPRLGNALEFTPGALPMGECAVRLAQLTGESAVSLRAELDQPAALGLLAKQHDVVLVVDQFEEIFTLCDEQQRKWLITALTSAPRVVVGVRADFYGHIGHHPELVEALDGAQLLVGPMTADELRRAITEPANSVGATVETALLTRLMADVAGQAAALPLVQHALVETWHRRRGMTLTLAGYVEAGGVEHAIARTAETVFSDLSEEQQTTAKQIFLRLIALGEGTEDTKRRANRAGLDDDVLDRLAAARLVSLSEHHVELSHEALIRSWPRLRDWIAEDREVLRVHHQLTEAAAGWDGHDQDVLYRGARLAQARGLDALTPHESAFLQASIALDLARLNAVRRRERRQRVLMSVLSVLVVLLAVTVVVAVTSSGEASRQRNEAVALRAADDATRLATIDPQLAAKVALAAHQVAPQQQQTADALLSTYAAASSITSTDPNVPAVHFQQISPNGKLAIGNVDPFGNRVWSLSEDKATPAAHIQIREPAAFSGDGATLVSLVPVKSPVTPQTQVIDLADAAKPRLVTTLPVAVRPAAISDDGKSFVGKVMELIGDNLIFDDRADALLWNLSDPTRPVSTRLPCNSVGDPAIRPDGRVVTTACEDDQGRTVVRSWRVEPDGLREAMTLQAKSGVKVRHSTAGRFLLIYYEGFRDAEVWDVSLAGLQSLWATFYELDGSTRELGFGHDDQMVVESTDRGVALWDISVKNRAPVRRASFSGFAGGIDGARYRPEHEDFITPVTRATRQLWRFPLSTDRAKAALCARGNVELSDEQWDRFFRGVKRLSVC